MSAAAWLLVLALAGSGHVLPPPSLPAAAHPAFQIEAAPAVTLTAQERWAWVVMGESGGGWPEGSRLVAWTLRAWQVELGMPAELAGPRWGWHGWRQPNAEARRAVAEAWDQPLSASPFGFMQAGDYCAHLGSAGDVRYWRYIGFLTRAPDYILTFEAAPVYSMNCFYEDRP